MHSVANATLLTTREYRGLQANIDLYTRSSLKSDQRQPKDLTQRVDGFEIDIRQANPERCTLPSTSVFAMAHIETNDGDVPDLIADAKFVARVSYQLERMYGA